MLAWMAMDGDICLGASADRRGKMGLLGHWQTRELEGTIMYDETIFAPLGKTVRREELATREGFGDELDGC